MSEHVELAGQLRDMFLALIPGEAAAVERFFTDATIAEGVVALDATEGPFKRGVGVIVNDDDQVLGRCFELRDRLDEQTFEHAWLLRDASWGMLGHPTRPHAMIRYAITADLTPPGESTPRPVRRALLLDVEQIPAVLLRRFGEPGTMIWLVPATVARQEAARRGMGSAFDVLSRCLPVGVSQGRRVESVERALTHAAPAGTGEEHRRGPPAFRAPREVAVARREDAIGVGDDDPSVGLPDRPPGIAVIGDPGTGRTSLLYRIAVLDDRDPELALVLVERGPGHAGIAGMPGIETRIEFDDLTAACREQRTRPLLRAIRQHRRILIRSDDGHTRLTAVRVALQTLRARRAPRKLSLIVDDADDLTGALAAALTGRPAALWPTVAWTITGSDTDARLLGVTGSLMVFRHASPNAAQLVVDELERHEAHRN